MSAPDTAPRLLISPAVAAELIAHARSAAPHEACGLLAGSTRSGRATSFHPARNEHASPLRFSVAPDDLVRVVLGIEAAGDELLAIFHSHVGSPAVPSATDIRETRYAGALHVLATLAEPDAGGTALRAWRIRDGEPHEVPVVIG